MHQCITYTLNNILNSELFFFLDRLRYNKGDYFTHSWSEKIDTRLS